MCRHMSNYSRIVLEYAKIKIGETIGITYNMLSDSEPNCIWSTVPKVCIITQRTDSDPKICLYLRKISTLVALQLQFTWPHLKGFAVGLCGSVKQWLINFYPPEMLNYLILPAINNKDVQGIAVTRRICMCFLDIKTKLPKKRG